MTQSTTIYAKAAAAGFIDEGTNTVTAECVADYLDDHKWTVLQQVRRDFDYTITTDEARERLQEHEGDIAAAVASFEQEAAEAAAYYEDCQQTVISTWYALNR